MLLSWVPWKRVQNVNKSKILLKWFNIKLKPSIYATLWGVNLRHYRCITQRFWLRLRSHCCPKKFYDIGQGTLKGEVLLYCWPPVWLVWNQLYDNWTFSFLFAIQTGQTGGQLYSDTSPFSVCIGHSSHIEIRNWGPWKLMGENRKVVRAEFSILSFIRFAS